MTLISPSIVWTDEFGLAELTCLGPTFMNWTPDTIDIGESEVPVGNSRTFFFAYRQDQIASFEIANIANAETPLALRLKSWLVRGGVVTIYTRDSLDRVYTSYIAPGTTPELTFSDTTALEYTLKLVVVNNTAAEMIYTPGVPIVRTNSLVLTPSPTSLAAGATSVITAKLLNSSLLPVVGATISAVSADTSKFTVSPSSGTTDGLGTVSFTITAVAPTSGTSLTATSGTLSATDTITVTGIGSVDFYNSVGGTGNHPYIDLAAGSVFASGSPPPEFTFECWAKQLHTYAGVGVLLSFDGINFLIGFHQSGGVLELFGQTSSTFSASTGSWVHVAYVRSTAGGYQRFFVNGVQHDTASDAALTSIAGSLRRIGGDGAGDSFQGRISDVRVWHVARTAAQILANYNKRLTGAEAGLSGYWPLNEGAGITVADLAGGAAGTFNGTSLGVAGTNSPTWSSDMPTFV